MALLQRELTNPLKTVWCVKITALTDAGPCQGLFYTALPQSCDDETLGAALGLN